jgi:hypothetical protein
MEIDATEPVTTHQEVNTNFVNGQHNYRRSERIKLKRASGKALKRVRAGTCPNWK